MDDDELWKIERVSEITGVPVATLHVWRTRKRGPAGFKIGRSLRYRRSEVLRWITEQERADRLSPTHGGAA